MPPMDPTDDERALIDHLHRIADVDPHARLLLTHGRLFRPPTPAQRTAPPGTCYQAAHRLAFGEASFYTEGLAWQGIVPLQHAWVSTPDGGVLDPSWADGPGSAYLGIPFTNRFVAEQTTRSGLYSIFEGDIRNDWQLATFGLPEDAVAPAGRPVAPYRKP